MKKVLSIFALLLALVTVSYAATQHSASVTLYEIVSVGSNKLPAGGLFAQLARRFWSS